MKQEYDKEIDSLLRRGARVAAAAQQSAASSRAPFASSHLDADELSAFAENALPAAARLAAASHLADCDECRGMVVQLASAADTAGEIEKRAAAAPVVPVEVPWWKTLLGSFFAPRVLRYAAPALVLGLVGVVSFIALRPRQGSVPTTVYQETAETRDASPAPGGNAETTTGTTANNNTGTSAPTTDNTSQTNGPGGVLGPVSPAKPSEQAPVVSQPVVPSLADRDAAPADAAGTGVAARKAGPVAETVEVERKEETKDRLAANTVAAPAPPPAAKSAGTEVTEMPKGVRNAEPARRETEAEGYDYTARAQQENRAANQSRSRQGEIQQTPDGGSPRNESRAMNNRGNVGGGVSQLPTTRSDRPAAKRGRSDDGKARDSAAAVDDAARVETTRSVGGRRFRREGAAWIDVNYKPSMSMTAVRRGTEGYRALVADIPELGRIAEQLGGEVITVVNGRAYRIR